ncbi:hypothetical protein AB2B41_21130 [Marimonas sp. MJW-29]|uniref:Antibiotic biosynthesis monooxygenase n=1 Tax=Sulfitobacter sediminis TaxID=3234186 RepID=A0ABV3RSZ4_9RHOB
MSETPHTVAEIVTFRLVPGTDTVAFVHAARALEPRLRATGHVLSRTLSADPDGTWTDHIVWTSHAVALQTAGEIMADPIAAPMMQMIDPDHVQMRHAEIHYRQE